MFNERYWKEKLRECMHWSQVSWEWIFSTFPFIVSHFSKRPHNCQFPNIAQKREIWKLNLARQEWGFVASLGRTMILLVDLWCKNSIDTQSSQWNSCLNVTLNGCPVHAQHCNGYRGGGQYVFRESIILYNTLKIYNFIYQLDCRPTKQGKSNWKLRL